MERRAGDTSGIKKAEPRYADCGGGKWQGNRERKVNSGIIDGIITQL